MTDADAHANLGVPADSPAGRRQLRAAIPHADFQTWNDYVDAIAGNLDALRASRAAGMLTLDELADLIEQLLIQTQFMARASRNTLGDLPDQVADLERRRPAARLRQLRANLTSRLRPGPRSTAPVPAPVMLFYPESPLTPPGEHSSHS